MTPLALAGTAVRTALFAAVLIVVGCAAFRLAILARLAGPGAIEVVRRTELRAGRLGATAACVAFVCALTRLPLQFFEIQDPNSPLGPQLRALVFHTMWGKAWFAQLAAATLSAFGLAFVDVDRRGPWIFSGVAATLLAFTPALSGHAIGSERFTMFAILADGLHVLAGGAWLGAMVVLYTAITIPRDTAHAAMAAMMVSAFSPLALSAAAVSALTGAFAAWLHLVVLSALWQSRYGRRLLLKLAAVALMAAVGAVNWRRNGPKLKQSNEIQPMRRSIGAELLMGVLVLLATAVLVVTPQPGEE